MDRYGFLFLAIFALCGFWCVECCIDYLKTRKRKYMVWAIVHNMISVVAAFLIGWRL